MTEYKPNSHKSRIEKKVEPVIKGKAKVKKQSDFSKFAKNIIADDISNIKTHLVKDVFLPSIRKTIWDLVTTGTSMLFGIDERDMKAKTGKTEYNRFSELKVNKATSSRSSRRDLDLDIEGFTLDSRADAEAVLDHLDFLIDKYDSASIADLYKLMDVEKSEIDYVHHDYGWTNLRDARVRRLRNGRYLLELPQVRSLK